MPNAYVLNTVISPGDKSAADKRLQTSGFTPVHGASVSPAAVARVSDIVIVLMPIDNAELSAVSSAVMALGLAGIRVIGLWLSGAAGAVLPNCIDKYGYSAVCLSSRHFDDVVNGRSPFWENSDCSPRDAQDIPRNRC